MATADVPRLLLTGAAGQVGWELRRTLAPLGPLVACDRAALDLDDPAAIRTLVRAERPDIIVNAAAYTQVDRAEDEPDAAARLNRDAPAVLAEEAARLGATLVHYSTDYVFDGRATAPYREDDPPAPRSVYGRTKREGEAAILASGADAFILRIAWVYGVRGRNFFRTMRRLATEGQPLRVVDDQRGTPTWARAVAETTALAIARLRPAADRPEPGIYHLASPDHTTWHGFAEAIVGSMARPAGTPVPTVAGVPTSAYPTRAVRPAWSVLDGDRFRRRFGLALPPWREQLARCTDDADLP